MGGRTLTAIKERAPAVTLKSGHEMMEKASVSNSKTISLNETAFAVQRKCACALDRRVACLVSEGVDASFWMVNSLLDPVNVTCAVSAA